MIDVTYIVETLGRFEGKAIQKGYVPKNRAGVPLGASGVTVGTGFDLGQQDTRTLASLKLPAPLSAKLKPYLGLRRDNADRFLADHPLELTKEETAALDKAVHEKYIGETAALFGPEFEDAPKQAQAVAVSLHYQFGTPFRAVSPGLALAWEAMRKRDFSTAAAYLTSPQGWSGEHKQYLPRREKEADLLREIRRMYE